jgi:hypothetical protein
MTKLRLPIFRADTESLEHFVLQFRLVNSHAAATDLDTIQNDVVRFGTNIGKLLFVK